MPTNPTAGDVIVMDNTATYTGSETIGWDGASGNPIWIMGIGENSSATISGEWTISGSYLVLDNLKFSWATRNELWLSGSNIMARHALLTNTYGGSAGELCDIAGDNIVVYHSEFGPSGNWQYTGGDIDRHGIKGDSGGSDIWILDSSFHHIQGDGAQIGDTFARANLQRVYVGRNTAYNNLQTGFWAKNAIDVIFSQNMVYNEIMHTSWSESACLGGQYDPQYVWFINNLCYDSINGVLVMGENSGGGGPWYVIGNVFDNVHSNTCNNYDYGTVHYRNNGGIAIVFNTMDAVDSYVTSAAGSGTITARSNIFGQRHADGTCDLLNMGTGGVFDNNLYYSNAYPVTFDGNGYASVTAYKAAESQDANSISGDPLFVGGGDYSLQSGSPAIGAGGQIEEAAFATFQSRYGIDIRKDIAGTTRPQSTWDQGAYEYVSGGTPPAGTSGSVFSLGSSIGGGVTIR